MTTDIREINRKRRILDHADESGNVAKTRRNKESVIIVISDKEIFSILFNSPT